MAYELRDGLSFCLVDGRAVFLDMREDKYFMLPTFLNDTFVRYVGMEAIPHAPDPALLRAGLFASKDGASGTLLAASEVRPARSLIEEPETAPRLRLRTFFGVAKVVYAMRSRLANRPLGVVLDDLGQERERMAGAALLAGDDVAAQRLRSAAAEFSSIRRHIPVRMSCLLDSLSLVAFLARRGLSARIVFGVTLAPFTAHCWVQHGDLALNESIDGAVARHPIMVW